MEWGQLILLVQAAVLGAEIDALAGAWMYNLATFFPLGITTPTSDLLKFGYIYILRYPSAMDSRAGIIQTLFTSTLH